MTLSPVGRIVLIALSLASGPCIAAPIQFSEKLADWHRAASASIDAVATETQAPLVLKATEDVGQSIIRELVLLKGRAMLGMRYVYGSNESDAVDCSALIQQLFQYAGIELPRTTHDLASIGEPVSKKSLQPGDLMFYRWKKHGLHVAIYAGDGLVIHASPGEHSVVITELNQAWNKHFVAARRIVPEGNT